MAVFVIALLVLLALAFLVVLYFFAGTFGRTRLGRPTATGRPTLDAQNRERGKAGEIEVTKILQRLPADYDIFTSVELPSEHAADRGVEMDHVVLSPFGIFVVETKRWGGLVQGGLEGGWVQTIGSRTHQKRNPYAQNDRQVRRLGRHLDVSRSAIRGVVCFVGDTTLGVDVPNNAISASVLNTYITGFRTPVLNNSGVADCRRALTELAGPPL